MNAVCVYCGSSFGAKPAYAEATRQLAIALAERKLRVVYGGASAGLMGLLADTALEHGGEVVGVIPRVLVDREVAHRGLTELHVVASMHERKAKMAELSDGFIALPGGIGTLEELIEVYTWSYLGIHDKPLGLVNTDGYYDGFTRLPRPFGRAKASCARKPARACVSRPRPRCCWTPWSAPGRDASIGDDARFGPGVAAGTFALRAWPVFQPAPRRQVSLAR